MESLIDYIYVECVAINVIVEIYVFILFMCKLLLLSQLCDN